nr:unnamed protein product [Spirometra erinaceieuropaei]
MQALPLPSGTTSRDNCPHESPPALQGAKLATIIGFYFPTMTDSDEAKNKSYEEMHALLVTMLRTDKLVVVVDFNARVRTDRAAWRGVWDPPGIVGCNDKGFLLLRT